MESRPAPDEDLTDAGPHRRQKQPGQDLRDPQSDDTEAGPGPGSDIRPAGPKEMDNPPKEWRKEDQESDESFPASDPPGNY